MFLSSPIIGHGKVNSVHQNTATTMTVSAACGSAAVAYMLCSNAAYVFRRSVLHSRMTPRSVLRAHTRRDGMSIPLFLACLFSWQCFVSFYPILETGCRLASHSCFFYYYPKAQGMGIVIEPLDVMHLPGNKRRKSQVRFDWHCIAMNIGPCSKNGFRHPPTIRRNLPHIDIPRLGIKHWPWRIMTNLSCEKCTNTRIDNRKSEEEKAVEAVATTRNSSIGKPKKVP